MRRLFLAALLPAAAAAAGELTSVESRVIAAARTARASVVTVMIDLKNTWHVTGVVVARDIVLTLRDPLLDQEGRPKAPIRVRYPGANLTVDAAVLDNDPETGTVLLKAPGGRARKIRPRLADRAHLGMWVLMVGNSFLAGRESSPTVSLGVVSGVYRNHEGVRGFTTSTLVNPGSFGAPVVDLDGGLLGIAAREVTPSGGQSVVIPYERILERFRTTGGPGAKTLGSHIYGTRRGSSLHEQFGIVTEAAAERARSALVGVRAGDFIDKRPEPAQPEKPEDPKRKLPPDPAPVPGRLPAQDRSSGTLLTRDGLVVCPLRVTGWPRGTRKLIVDLPGGEARQAELLGSDERFRIALLSVDVDGIELPARASVADLEPGRFVLALGFPHEEPGTGTPQVTFGVVSRTGALRDIFAGIKAVQTDAGVAGGNRGGPLIDIEGRLIGVLLDVDDTNLQGYRLRKRGAYAGNAGLGFAVPLEVLDTIVPRMAKGERIEDPRARPRPKLGVTVSEVAEGVRLDMVAEGGGAHAAGLEEGDVIVALDGAEIATLQGLRTELEKHKPGDEVEVTYLRDGQRATAQVTLGT